MIRITNEEIPCAFFQKRIKKACIRTKRVLVINSMANVHQKRFNIFREELKFVAVWFTLRWSFVYQHYVTDCNFFIAHESTFSNSRISMMRATHQKDQPKKHPGLYRISDQLLSLCVKDYMACNPSNLCEKLKFLSVHPASKLTLLFWMAPTRCSRTFFDKSTKLCSTLVFDFFNASLKIAFSLLRPGTLSNGQLLYMGRGLA